MPIALPLVTRREIAREYRLDAEVTEASAIRALRSRGALSEGLTVELRRAAGTLGGRLHLYSALNLDAARALRHHHERLAGQLRKAARSIEQSPQTHRLAEQIATRGPADTAALAAIFSESPLAADVAALVRKSAAIKAKASEAIGITTLTGYLVGAREEIAVLEVRQGDERATWSFPLSLARDAGVARPGAAITATWEILSNGRTLVTVEPAVDIHETTEDGTPLVDMYGTPWGRILAGTAPADLDPEGVPPVSIPAGIPDIE